MALDFIKSRDSYITKLAEADRKFNEAERRWRTFKRRLAETKWEHDLTTNQREMLKNYPEELLDDVRRYFHRSEFYAMKIRWYQLKINGPPPGKDQQQYP